uniref:Fibronectin type-II domain-containing protein n=1 Tax=Naja naja TaxID=35670 RepID=A0A8C7E5M5_NAJNA
MTRISSVLILSSFTISDTPSCVFPFIYHGKSYYSCTKVDSQNHPWCATTGVSSVLILSSFTISDTPSCVFPFIYHGKSYYSCTKVDSQNHPWCATTANYDKSPQWKYRATKEYGGNSLLEFWYCLFSILVPPPCVFPFIYRGKSYNSCTEDASENRPWCATIANYDQYKTWKYCATKEYGGNSDGKQCAFPFTYKNQTYYTCTNEDAEIGRFWCATTGSYDKEEQWSYCADTSKITVVFAYLV